MGESTFFVRFLCLCPVVTDRLTRNKETAVTKPSHPWRNIAGAAALLLVSGALSAEPLGLPPVPVPANNPQTPAKIALGDKLFHDERFSTTGKVSCATCHDRSRR